MTYSYRNSILIIIAMICLIQILVAYGFAEPARAADTARIWQDNPYGVRVTRDQFNTPLEGFVEWTATHPVQPFSTRTAGHILSTVKGVDDREFAIIVNATLLPSIQSSIDQYQIDLDADGFSSTVYAMSGGTPDSLRLFLQTCYGAGTVGAILIGDLPVAWYEAECWDPSEHEEFPCDLYYMDLDGMWDDMDFDGRFDYHAGDLAPEIWVGRLTPSTLTYGGQTEAELLNNYFVKNHAYRTGQLIFADRGLAFIDDDWSMYGWENDLGRSYDSVVAIVDDYATTAPNYRNHLPQNYESILLCAHSSPNLHQFKTPSGDWSWIYYNEIVDLDPVAGFYNMFNCSGSRYTTNNYLGGWYIFCQNYGLATIGSTKTGSMLNFEFFYPSWDQGKTFGECFANWFSGVGADGMEDWEICWFYGMTVNGDPTLVKSPFSLPRIMTESLPDAMYQEEYSYMLSASGGVPPYVWSMIGGYCPEDLKLDTATGELFGTATEVGHFSVQFKVEDSADPTHSDTITYALSVNYICGDANGDDVANIADAVHIINYVFRSGPASIPAQASDANCSGDTDVGDVVYLINFAFRGGEPPCCQ